MVRWGRRPLLFQRRRVEFFAVNKKSMGWECDCWKILKKPFRWRSLPIGVRNLPEVLFWPLTKPPSFKLNSGHSYSANEHFYIAPSSISWFVWVKANLWKFFLEIPRKLVSQSNWAYCTDMCLYSHIKWVSICIKSRKQKKRIFF